MNYFERVEASFDELPYMRHPQATFMREFIIEHDVRDILEIGFYHGKSSAYFAAILEDLGRGHLVTIDRENALHREPDIMRVLSTLDLTHRVTPVFAERSFTWELGKMLQGKPLPQFDLCYFDGGDGDGIDDGTDRCLETALGHVVDPDGCSVADRCPCDSDWRNHGPYVRCVAHVSGAYRDFGLFTPTQRGEVVAAAAESPCGR
jgi:predicted O-methyltransferase YrrM